MCLKQRSAAKRNPLARMVDFFLARTRDRINNPYIKPLYWKWIWSMIKRPGDSRTESAAAWEGRLKAAGED
jgi:hypothetical protein